jgi:inositol-polyphosphate multikinase
MIDDDKIILQDLTNGMSDPCIVDLKLGKRLYDDDCTPEKKERMEKVSQDTTSGILTSRKASLG